MVSTKLGSDNEFWSSVNLTQVIQRQLDVVVEDAAPLTPTLSTRMDVVNDEEATQEEGGGPSEEIKMPKLTRRDNATEPNVETNDKNATKLTGQALKQREIPYVDEIDIDDMEKMVPIMIKTSLSEFQQHFGQGGVILAGKNLSWFEFVQMFIEEPNDYDLRGEDGRILLIESKIGDYVDTFKRSANCYLVSIEKRVQANLKAGTTHADLKKNIKRKSSRRRRSPYRIPRRRQIKTIAKELVQIVPFEVSESVDADESSSSSSNPARNLNKRSLDSSLDAVQDTRQTKKSRVTPPTNNKSQVVDSIGTSGRHISLTKLTSKAEDVPELSDELPKQNDMISIRNKQDQSSTRPTHITLPNIKPQLMTFVINKISNRDLLKIRGELMKLRDEEDYFKLTTLAPMTAGLLDQMLCRNLPDPASSGHAS